MLKVNHCVFLSRDGERQFSGCFCGGGGGGEAFARGEGRAATQRHPMNIWSSAADCVWALSTHNVSFGGHLTSKRWTIRRNSHNSSGSAVAVQLFQQLMQFSLSAQVLTLNMGASSFSKETDKISVLPSDHPSLHMGLGVIGEVSSTFCCLKKGKPSSPGHTPHA